MKKVGIIPSTNLLETDNPYHDRSQFLELYTRRITENGGLPLGILNVGGFLSEEALEVCDSFLICGGKRIFPYHFQVIDYALRSGKRLLGVCLGMQAIHSYFIAKREQKTRPGKSILEVYEEMKKEKYFFVEPVKEHWKLNPNRGEENLVKHKVVLSEDSVLRKYFPEKEIEGASMHNYRITEPSEELKVVGHSEDGTIEAIEYGEKVLGIQFHPEIDGSFPGIFRFLTGFPLEG